MPVANMTSSVYLQRFAVNYEYPVHFTNGLLDPANTILRDTLSRLEPRAAASLPGVSSTMASWPRVPSFWPRSRPTPGRMRPRSSWSSPPLPFRAAKKIKNELFHIEWMMGLIQQHQIDRHSFVIAIGGGAVLDAVGLAAATSHRGIRHIRVPTTVLSQNDSGVGVKNGVNLKGSKNFIGTFAPPFAVLNDLDFIADLPAREKTAGMAEAVKVALIRDAVFFNWLERHVDALTLFEPGVMATMIRRCAELHMHQIAHAGDPFECGSARPLDFGHWAAHKIESLTRNHVRHGEAVAIGIALDTRYSGARRLAGSRSRRSGGSLARVARLRPMASRARSARQRW